MALVLDEYGIADGYLGTDDEWHESLPEVREHLRALLGPLAEPGPSWFVEHGTHHHLWGPCRLLLEDGRDLGVVHELTGDVPLGYHTLQPVDGGPETWLVVHPARCPEAPVAWGIAVQVASLQRPDGWGIGDLGDVTDLGNELAAVGGGLILLSPLHAPGPVVPLEDSPYYPSSRRWWSPLLTVPSPDTPQPPATPDGLVDRNAAWRTRRQWLGGRFDREHDDPQWRAWARAQGPSLWRYATWNALADEFGVQWRQWPEQYRHPDSPALQDRPLHDPDFARRCEFHAFVQWVVAGQLDATAARAGVGLIGDLAIGCSSDGADAWADQDVLALGVSIGAPPDSFNTAGQSWGLPPYRADRLKAARYRPFIEMLRAAMHGMAGLRMDHVMGLFRQWWIPDGRPPTDGAYVQMPSDELLAILCLEAHRAGCFVVGEDLGTVAPEVTAALAKWGILGTTVWWFDPEFDEWRTEALATITTHDLPTVLGVAAHTDGDEAMQDQLDEFLADTGTRGEAVVDELHRRLLASPAKVRLLSADDLAGQLERPNYPGTTGETHPNWRRRLPVTVDRLVARCPR